MGRYDNVILPAGGQKLSVSQFGVPVKAALDDIDNRINASNTGSTRCRAYATSNQSVPHSTLTVIALAGETYKTVAGMHSTVTNNSRMVSTINGLWHIDVMLGWDVGATGRRVLQIRKNAAGSSSGGTQLHTQSIQASSASGTCDGFGDDVLLSQGDYLEIFGLQTNGGALLTAGNEWTVFFSMRLVDFA